MDASLQFLYELAENYRAYFAVFFFLLGISLASFVNVCVYRLPENLSIVRPRSFCPHCKKGICWYDNIPLASFILLHAKCRACSGKISPRYFFVELTGGLIFLGLFLYSGFSPELFWAAYLIFSLLVITLTDFSHMIIPDEISISGIFAGWLFAFTFPEIFGELSRRTALGEAVLGAFTGFALIWITAFIGDNVLKKESMGGGDIKLMAMIGAFTGVQGAVLTFFLAPFLALPWALFQKFFRGNSIVPYGPFLAIAAVINVFFSDWLLNVIVGR